MSVLANVNHFEMSMGSELKWASKLSVIHLSLARFSYLVSLHSIELKQGSESSVYLVDGCQYFFVLHLYVV